MTLQDVYANPLQNTRAGRRWPCPFGQDHRQYLNARAAFSTQW